MKKKIFILAMIFVMVLPLVACGGGGEKPAPGSETPAPGSETPAPGSETPAGGNYKIGIITGTVSQGEEEFQAAQKWAKDRPDMIVTATYPDNFTAETETTIANVASLAADPDVKAIVFVQAVPGASAAIDKVRETRPDMLFVCGVAAEDPATIASKADIVMLADEISMGNTIPTKAKEMGAKTFIHYSFARHLSYATIAARREKMIATCKELGIEFVDVTAPDPTGDAGVSGAQQFILEDVPRQIAKYGTDTAFFSTNCAMQEPLIKTIADQKAIFPQQCCPSPFHGYPAGLGIQIDGKEGDVDYMLSQIKAKLTDLGQEGRMSTWGVPVNMLMVDAGVNYAMKFCEGKTSARFDEKVFKEVITELEAKTGKITLTPYKDDSVGQLDNFFMVLCDFYDFSK